MIAFIFLFLVVAGVPSAFAKCADRRVFYCVPAVFQGSDPSLKKASHFPGHCAGWMRVKNERWPVVFQETASCPANDTRMNGHLISICQDTGRWTEATFWFTNKPFFCGMSKKERKKHARTMAGKVREGMTRAQVRELLKEYEFIGGGFSATFAEQYYGHPGVVIEVPFEQPGGNYSSENKVNGPLKIAEMELPQP